MRLGPFTLNRDGLFYEQYGIKLFGLSVCLLLSGILFLTSTLWWQGLVPLLFIPLPIIHGRLTRMDAPRGAHGQRNVDGSYFSIWECPYGHKQVGGVYTPPAELHCMTCSFGRFENGSSSQPDPQGEWRRCSRKAAHAWIEELEGEERAHDEIGFRLL